jgi:hypothetical protein
MQYSKKIRSAYYNAKDRSKTRKIPFLFTMDQWVNWWVGNLGPDWMSKRGARRGQYVMARFHDKGSYILGNTKCILSEDNHIEYNKERKRVSMMDAAQHLDRATVIAIYLDDRRYRKIAEDYKVTKHRIQCIKQKHYYRKYTDPLDAVIKKRRALLERL